MEQTARFFGYNVQTVGALANFIAAAPSRIWYSLQRLCEVSRQRRQLRNLDSRLLDDIGIDRKQALKEARRPIWDI